jgi:hypothetical protein
MDVISGVKYLHTHQPLLVHGDLKSVSGVFVRVVRLSNHIHSGMF